MIRFVFRVLSLFALAVAVTMAVIDATRSVAASLLVLTPLSQSWESVSPDTLATVEASVRQNLWPWVWDPVLIHVLSAPGFLVFAVLAFILHAVGRRPRRQRRDTAYDL